MNIPPPPPPPPPYNFSNQFSYYFPPPPTPPNQDQSSNNWTFDENKVFENTIAEFDHIPHHHHHHHYQNDNPLLDLCVRIATILPWKTFNQIHTHYQDLIGDVEMIELGLIPLPNYPINSCSIKETATAIKCNKQHHQIRKKGTPWTSQEHDLFLEGLETYAKGDWRSISRSCVVTKTPSQVTSHAQKYFLRLKKRGIDSTSKQHNNINKTTSTSSSST